ncbi:hypothetical protein KML24008_16100 [Alistipes onderdonkii]
MYANFRLEFLTDQIFEIYFLGRIGNKTEKSLKLRRIPQQSEKYLLKKIVFPLKSRDFVVE